MRAFIILAVLPLALGNVGSFVKISGFGQSYEYGNGEVHHHAPQPLPHHQPEPAYQPTPAPAHETTAAPAYNHPAPVHHAPVHHAPAYGHHAPAYGHPAPAYGHHAPAYGHPAPAYGHPAPAYGHHAPAYGGYGYEEPKHNCSVVDVTEVAEVCTPAFETVCENEELPVKNIVDKEFCYDVVRTVCTESIEEIPNEICTYSYERKEEATSAKTVEVMFEKQTNVQMVTVCQPGQGYGYGYGHGKYCKEVAQETAYNVPIVTPIDVAVTVAYPEPIKSCVNKPISLPRVSCEDLTENKCITVPEIEDAVETIEKCQTQLAAPACQQVELTLPKQVCIELVYGYAHEEHPAPAYGHH